MVVPAPACFCLWGAVANTWPPTAQVQLEPIRRASGGAAGQLAPKYTGMLQAVRTIVREEGVLVSTTVGSPLYPHPDPAARHVDTYTMSLQQLLDNNAPS